MIPFNVTWKEASLSKKKFPSDFSRSQVKVLAFLKASCGFCQTQLARLIDLQNEFNKQTNMNISIVVINAFDADSFKNRHVFAEINRNKTGKLNKINCLLLMSVGELFKLFNFLSYDCSRY